MAGDAPFPIGEVSKTEAYEYSWYQVLKRLSIDRRTSEPREEPVDERPAGDA